MYTVQRPLCPERVLKRVIRIDPIPPVWQFKSFESFLQFPCGVISPRNNMCRCSTRSPMDDVRSHAGTSFTRPLFGQTEARATAPQLSSRKIRHSSRFLAIHTGNVALTNSLGKTRAQT